MMASSVRPRMVPNTSDAAREAGAAEHHGGQHVELRPTSTVGVTDCASCAWTREAMPAASP